MYIIRETLDDYEINVMRRKRIAYVTSLKIKIQHLNVG